MTRSLSAGVTGSSAAKTGAWSGYLNGIAYMVSTGVTNGEIYSIEVGGSTPGNHTEISGTLSKTAKGTREFGILTHP